MMTQSKWILRWPKANGYEHGKAHMDMMTPGRFLFRQVIWVGLLVFFVCIGACQESWELQKEPSCAPAPHLSGHPLWGETFASNRKAAHACLRVAWGDNDDQSISQLVLLRDNGTLRARTQPNAADFTAPLTLSLPQAADGKPLRFQVFVFGADLQDKAPGPMEALCQNAMKKPAYRCLSRAEGECWFALSIRPKSNDLSRTSPLLGNPNAACTLQFRESTDEPETTDANEPASIQDEPPLQDIPTPQDEPASTDKPQAPDEPLAQDEPQRPDEPQIQDKPQVQDEPQIQDTPQSSDEPLVTEQPAVETPVLPEGCPSGTTSTPEVCDGKDNDCDGLIDEGLPNCQQSICKGKYPCVVTFAGPAFYIYEFPKEYLRFTDPKGVAFDAAGNLYVADAGNHTIWKIDTAGLATAFAGFVEGAQDGKGTLAQFSSPYGLAFDPAGNLYVADTGNHRIRKIDPAGNVTTLAGSLAGFNDSKGTLARFNSPRGVVFDAGSLYVADTGNYRIRKIDSAGNVTTLAGGSSQGLVDGNSISARFRSPYGLALDGKGFLYVADSDNHRVRKIDLTTQAVTTYPNASAVVSTPNALAFDPAGNLYVGSHNSLAYQIDTVGNVSVYAGSSWGFVDAQGSAARFKRLHGLAFANNKLYTTDFENNVVRTIDLAGNVATFAGNFVAGHQDGSGAGILFTGPVGLAFDPTGNLYVADTDNHKVRKIDASGQSTTVAGKGFNNPLIFPHGVAFGGNGTLYVSDTGNHKIKKIDATGVVSTFAGSAAGNADGNGTLAQLNAPAGSVFDSAGNLYVADSGNHRIRKITPAGDVTTFAGSTAGSGDGKGTLAQFNNPRGLAFDATGNLYVADTGNHRIRKIDTTGNVTTFAGSSQGYQDNNTGIFARFNGPQGLAFDAAGNLYVTDTDNHKIRIITPTGAVSTYTGSTGNYRDGPLAEAMFHAPSDLIFDQNGDLYVSDRLTHSIRKVVMKAPVP